MNNKKIKINDKERTVRFNMDKMCFECNIGFKDDNGVQQSRIVRGETIDKLETNVKEFEDRLAQTLVSLKNTTLAAFSEFYFNNIAPVVNTKTTIQQKRSVFNRISDTIKNTPLVELTPIQLQQFYTDCYKRLSSNTVYGYHELLNTILNCAVEYGKLTKNPNRKCSVKPLQNGKKIYWSIDTCKQFLTFLQGDKRFTDLYKPVLFAMVTGARRGETVGVKYEYVDYNDYLVKLYGQLKTEDNKTVYSEELKTEKSKRTVKISADIFVQIFGKKNIQNTGFVFLHKGEPWNVSTFSRRLKEAFVAFGEPEMSIKHLRSSFVKTQVQNNTPLKAIQVMLGHSKLSTTADIYGELTNEDTYQYADNMLAIWH